MVACGLSEMPLRGEVTKPQEGLVALLRTALGGGLSRGKFAVVSL